MSVEDYYRIPKHVTRWIEADLPVVMKAYYHCACGEWVQIKDSIEHGKVCRHTAEIIEAAFRDPFPALPDET